MRLRIMVFAQWASHISHANDVNLQMYPKNRENIDELLLLQNFLNK